MWKGEERTKNYEHEKYTGLDFDVMVSATQSSKRIPGGVAEET